MKYLVVGLGNIGAEYADTRHNIGFKVLDCLAEQSNIAFTTGRYGATAELRYKGRTLVLLKPSTYMNLSGKAVRYWMEAEKIAPENLLVVVDDIALPFGTLRMRPKGSAGGHNGLKNITELLGTEAYARIRFGIGGDFARGPRHWKPARASFRAARWSSPPARRLVPWAFPARRHSSARAFTTAPPATARPIGARPWRWWAAATLPRRTP